jgi:hypothetical protein
VALGVALETEGVILDVVLGVVLEAEGKSLDVVLGMALGVVLETEDVVLESVDKGVENLNVRLDGIEESADKGVVCDGAVVNVAPKTEGALGIEGHVVVAIVDEKRVVDIVQEGCVGDSLVANVDSFEHVVGYEDAIRKADCYNCTALANVVAARLEEDMVGEEEAE